MVKRCLEVVKQCASSVRSFNTEWMPCVDHVGLADKVFVWHDASKDFPHPFPKARMTTRVISNVLSFLGIPTSSDDNHTIRHTDSSQRHRVHPRKEITNSGSKGVSSANSSTDRGLATAISKVNEESESSQKVSRRRGTHEASEVKRDVANIKRLSYLRDPETSHRKKKKETLKELPKATQNDVLIGPLTEPPKDTRRESRKESLKEPLRETLKALPKETLKEPTDTLTDSRKETLEDLPRETPNELHKEPPKETLKELRKESLKELPVQTLPVLRAPVKEVTIDSESLKEQLRSTQKELLDANQKFSNAQRRILAVEKERETLATKLKSAITDRNALANISDGKIAELDGRNRKLEEELRNIRDTLRASDERNSQLSKLLEEKTADFKGTQTFLTTADLYSGAEVISMVETLNAEIFQISAFTAELLEDESNHASQDERNANVYQHADSLEIASQRIGHEFLEHLNDRFPDVRVDPLPLQLAVQALLSAQCVHEIQSFRSDELGSNLDLLYRQIKTSEVQAVAGRWRAITSATLRNSFDYSITNVTFEMIVGLLCLCGCSMSNQKSRQAMSTMEKMLNSLEKLQTKLKTAVKEGITTTDFEVTLAASGDSFNPSWMEDVYADISNDLKDTREAERRVLTTVGVGLQKRVTKTTSGGVQRDQVDVLYKTKVVLLSVLRVFNETQDDG